MNNKYLSGLLAGVLAAGVLQGSDGKENMPGLGGEQTPVELTHLTIGEIPLEDMASELAAAYDERAEGSQNQSKKEEFRAKAQALRDEFKVKNSEKDLAVNNRIEVKEIRYRYANKLADYYKQKEEGEAHEFARELKNDFACLDYYTAFIASQKFENNDDFRNYLVSKTRFGYETHINNAPIRNEADAKLYLKLETQRIFGSNDYILPGMYQYIITYPVTKAEIESWVTKLRDMHTSKALTPIVFECQSLECFGYLPSLSDEIVKESEGFKIKSYCCGRAEASDLEHDPWGGETIKLLDDKPIIFGKIRGLEVDDADKALIKSPFNFQKAAMCEFTNISYEKYDIICKRHMKYELPFDDISFFRVDITGNSPEIQRQQLKVLSEDKRVLGIGFDQEKCHIIEAIGNIKCIDIVSFSEDIVMQKSPSISNYYTTNHENIYSLIAAASKSPETIYNTDGSYQTCGNRVLREKYQKYIKYVEDHNLEYLSGFINFDKKPDYLSNEEWQKVEILTKMVDEFVALADKY